MNELFYSCEEGCGISTAVTCPKWQECYSGDLYKDTRKEIQNTIDKLKKGWTFKIGGGMEPPK